MFQLFLLSSEQNGLAGDVQLLARCAPKLTYGN